MAYLNVQKGCRCPCGFRFASLRATALEKAGDIYLADDEEPVDITKAVDSGNILDDGDSIPEWTKEECEEDQGTTTCTGGTDVNTDYYLLKSSGDVEVQWNAAPDLDGDPKIDFRLTGTGRGTITIEYHVWKYIGNKKLVGTVENAATQTNKGNALDKATKAISLDIVTCNSPPNRLSACPGSGLDPP